MSAFIPASCLHWAHMSLEEPVSKVSPNLFLLAEKQKQSPVTGGQQSQYAGNGSTNMLEGGQVLPSLGFCHFTLVWDKKEPLQCQILFFSNLVYIVVAP